MQYLKFFLKPDQNPVLPILILLAALVALAPDFEVPRSSPAGPDPQTAQRWLAAD